MNTQEFFYIDRVQALYPQEGEASAEALALVEQAVAECPKCAKLWCLRGDLIQLGGPESRYELADALRSYEQAIAFDPLCAEAYESLGFFYDAVIDAPESAEPFFREAIRLGAGINSFCGLARVLAELNRKAEALRLLAPENCASHDASEIKELREEIASCMWSNDSRA